MSWTNVKEWGWRGVIVSWLVVLTLALLALPEIIDPTPLRDDSPRIVAPASPGLASAIAVCKNGEVSKHELVDSPGTYRYIAIFGLSVVEWPDSPKGKQPIALVDGEPVMLSDEVQKCLRDRS